MSILIVIADASRARFLTADTRDAALVEGADFVQPRISKFVPANGKPSMNMAWNGFKGLGDKVSIVANCATIPHDPTEIERKPAFDTSIPYDWKIQHK